MMRHGWNTTFFLGYVLWTSAADYAKRTRHRRKGVQPIKHNSLYLCKKTITLYFRDLPFCWTEAYRVDLPKTIVRKRARINGVDVRIHFPGIRERNPRRGAAVGSSGAIFDSPTLSFHPFSTISPTSRSSGIKPPRHNPLVREKFPRGENNRYHCIHPGRVSNERRHKSWLLNWGRGIVFELFWPF